MKKKIAIISILYLILSGINQSYANNFVIESENGIAGRNILIKSNELSDINSALFIINKPNGETLKLQGKKTELGNFEVNFSGYHTKTSGKYNILCVLDNGDKRSSFFNIYPDNISSKESKIIVNNNSIIAKKGILVLKVIIKDRYGNLINNHKIKLISSRYEDEFENEKISDEKGIAEFNIKSNIAGLSTFTAIDLNENVIIKNREKIIFYNEKETNPIGGNLLLGSLIGNKGLIGNNGNNNNYGSIDHFQIETSDIITLNDSNNYISIRAVDINGNTVTNYHGTVLMEIPEDENASLPGEGVYTFKIEDLGERKFYLSQTFTKIGNLTLNVYEFENGKINENIKGTKNIEIKKEGSTDNNGGFGQNGEIKIVSPTTGTRIGSNRINITGKGVPYTLLKIFINERKEGDDIEVGGDGIFSATVKGLLDGENTIYVHEKEGEKRSSEEIKIYIDTQAPVINDFQIFPKNQIQKEDKFNVTLYSEKNLASVKIMIDGNIETLNEKIGEEGTYESNLIAPAYSGEFPIDIILVDQLSNKNTLKNYAKLIVKEKAMLPPNKINNINIIANEDNIILKWEKPESSNEIDVYKIYLGESDNNLEYFGSSRINDITIENLQSNIKYYLQISAIDIEGLESEKSNINETETKGRNNDINEEYNGSKNEILRAVSGDSNVRLDWDSLGSDIYKYKIKYGIKINNFEESIITKNNLNNYTIDDLINGLPYYFQVIGLNQLGNEITERSNIIKSTPNGKGFIKRGAYFDNNKFLKVDNIDSIILEKKGQNPKTGPEIWFLLAITILISDILYRQRKGQNGQLKK